LLSVSLIFIISLSFVSANVFSDFWDWLTGENDVGFSPAGVDVYCSQVGGYDIWTREKTSEGYGITDDELINCFPKLDNGLFLNYNDAVNSGCGNYVCALYRGIQDGILTSATTDKKCAQENGWPLSGVETACATWCPSSLNQVWSSSENKCVTQTKSGPVCGNNILETGEECDTQKLNSQSCITKGYDGGILKCNAQCKFDSSACVNDIICGDGKAEGSEVCDGSDLKGKICVSLGFTSGSLNCKTDCTFNIIKCVSTTPYVPVCGNSIVDSSSGEQCDDGNTNNNDACKSDCKLNVCGDGIINSYSETCDDKNTIPGDGCNGICQINSGWSCVYDNNLMKSVCALQKIETCVDLSKRNCGTTDVGACEFGIQTCGKGAWGSCIGEVGPQAETKNGIDDDCDGEVDEGVCPVGYILKCPDGYVEVQSSSIGNSIYEKLNCQGREEVLNEQVSSARHVPQIPYRSDGRIVCREKLDNVNFFANSFNSGGRCINYDSPVEPIETFYEVKEISCIGPITKGLVAYYPFNDDFKDYSGNGNDGEIYGDFSIQVDFLGDEYPLLGNRGALAYNNQRLEILDSQTLDIIDEITISAWIDSSRDNKYMFGIFSKFDPISFNGFLFTYNQNNDNKLAFYEKDIGWIKSIGEIPFSGLHYVVITGGKSNGKFKFYIDGVESGSYSFHSLSVNDDIAKIGGLDDVQLGYDWFFIDDVKVYNRVLSQEEILSEYSYLISEVIPYVPSSCKDSDNTTYIYDSQYHRIFNEDSFYKLAC